MKKKRSSIIPYTGWKKLFLMARITTVLLFAGLMQVTASVYSQQTKLNLKLKDAPVESVLKAIEGQSEFYFLYRSDNLKKIPGADLDVKKASLEEVLNRVIVPYGFDYEIDDRVVVIKKVEKTFTEEQVLQQKTISGKVTDSSGAPLPGVTVVVKGTTQGTITDGDGNYSLPNVPGDGTLVFSFVGMKTQEIAVGSQTNINVTMEEETIGIEEVVAIGYGTVRKSDLTSAIAKVSGETLELRPTTTLDQALQGQLAGVEVQQSGGRPGKNATIRIRGVGSVTAGNDPLYVVDGMTVDEETFSNLGLANIESVEVLKDAASASIYGSRGSNGVIIVTTKHGREGQKQKLDFNVYSGISNIERRIDLLNTQEFLDYTIEARDQAYYHTGGDPNIPPDDRPSSLQRYYQDWKDHPENYPTYDHLGAVLQTGKTQSYQLSASGATNKVRYMVSGEYYNQTGIVKNTDFTRYSFRSNIDIDINKIFTIGLKFAPSYTVEYDKDTEGSGYRDSHAGVMQFALEGGVPVLPPRLGYWGESEPFSDFLLNTETYKAIAKIEQLKDEADRGNVLANAYVQVNLLPELRFKSSFNTNYTSYRRDRFENQIIMRTQDPQGENWNAQSLNWLSENILTYEKSLKKHHVDALLGFTAQNEKIKNSYIRGTGFSNDYVPTLNAASEWVANTTMSEWSLLSFLSRVRYSFSDKYLLSASIRTDGSSRFGAEKKWGWFPSFSAGWRIDQEEFLKSNELINRLKLRASWGKTGNNNIGNYTAIGLMGTSAYLFGTDETKILGAQPISISSPNLGWEMTATTDIGIDLGLFNNRLSFSADYYNSQTSDLLLNVPVPAITGFTSEIQNIGKVENKGWEFELSSVNVNGEFNWTTNFNLTFNKNTVKQLGPDDSPIITGYHDYQYSITKRGYPIGSFYMLKQTGIFNTQEEIDAAPHWPGAIPGDVIIEDYNKDGKINHDDRQIFGSNNPKYFFGITNQFIYKGFDLSIFINGLGGNQILNLLSYSLDSSANIHKAKYKAWVNRWRSPEDPGDGITPRAIGDVIGAANERTSRTLYDGDYIRLKNLTVGYTLPSQLINKLKLSKLRIYVQGENLFLWDKYKRDGYVVGFTPEGDLNNGNALAGGYDLGIYPSTRTFIFGVNVSF